MRRNILSLAEEHILQEQLRLLLGNVGSSVITAILLALLLVWSLTNSSNALGLELWCGAVILSKLYAAYDARRLLKTDISSCRAQRTVWRLLMLNAIDGAAWGGLAWVALGTTSVTGNILVIAVLAGILGSSMSLLSPILPVFFVFCAFEFAPLAIKLWILNDPAYNALAGAAILYIATLLGQARNSAIAARTAIELRFKNVDLIERLREETLKAEKANLAKSKFLAAASHDLRQPIHALGLFLDALARSELTENQRKTLTSACAVSDASAEILNTLLDFSRIEAGAVEPHSRPFHLQPLLNKIENELAPQADAKGLIYRSRETHLAVQSDPALVKLILRNLVSNAIRYTKQGGLLVACRTRGDEVVLEVWDTGIGIDPSQQQAIFREFHQLGSTEPDRRKGLSVQLSNTGPDRRKGLGLGLAIVDRLVQKLGLKIELVSTPHHGSVFRLSLPTAHAAVAINDFETTQVNVRELHARVLVLDDDAAVRDGMRYLLRDWGCECETVESIEQALVSVRAQRPDLLISDYRLSEHRTGTEAIAVLRAELGQDFPAILITADTAPERLREALASGVPLLHKPVSPTQLNRRLVDLLANAQEPAITRT